jgi:AcrR family transcriptional regulator
MPSAASSSRSRSSRRLILDAALSAFDSYGYGGTTMSEIRRASGVSNGSLYHHFPGKEHVAATLFADGVSDYQDGFLAMLDEVADPEAGIRGGVLFHLRWAARNRELARFLLYAIEADVAAASEREAPDGRRFLRGVHAWLRAAVRAGAIVELPRELYYPIWIGPAQELTRQLLGGRVRLSARSAEQQLADEAWRSLRAL